MRIGLDHVHIFASDPAVTLRFFQTMLGATMVWDEVVAGARVIRLQLDSAFVQIYDQPPRSPRGGAFHHIGIETDDLDGLVNDIRSKGFEFRNQVRDEKTFRYVMIAGPDDLLIELFECREPQRWRIRTQAAREPQHS